MRHSAMLLFAACSLSTLLATAGCSDTLDPNEPEADRSAVQSVSASASRLPVFPGARGFGATTPAGRGGQVIRVTNLNASGPGSLRAALEASGKRTVVFDVSGMITLTDHIYIRNPFITVAGQTAPSPGITIRGGGIVILTHDVLVQHLRIRPGDLRPGPNGTQHWAIMIRGSSFTPGSGPYNVVVDHVSASWAADQVATTFFSLTDVTYSNCIFSEGLHSSFHPEGGHSKGLFAGNRTKRVAFIGNLVAHNHDRNAFWSGGSTGVQVNNVIYNWGNGRATRISEGTIERGEPNLVSVVGNVFKRGKDTATPDYPIAVGPVLANGSKVYVADNAHPRRTADPWSVVDNDAGAWVKASTPPVWPSGLTAMPSADVESWVLSYAGARPADRDAVDARVVNDVRAGTGRIIDSQSQVGGWPVMPVTRRTFPVPANPDGDSDRDGYTNLEEVLHQYAAQIEGRRAF